MKKLLCLLVTFTLFASCKKEISSDIASEEFVSAAASAKPTRESYVKIGRQKWMQKNLDVTTYRNGDPIPQVTDLTEWNNLTSGAWCYYNNDPATGAIYGRIYNGYAVIDPRGLAPNGWHIPTYNEWVAVIDYFGGENLGGPEKAYWAMRQTGCLSAGTGLWDYPCDDQFITNSTGFTALPGGGRFSTGFTGQGKIGNFWSSTLYNDVGLFFVPFDDQAVRTNAEPQYRSSAQYISGSSIRCIRN